MEEERRRHWKKMRKGIGFILIAWFCFTMMAFIFRVLNKSLPLPEILFVQNFLSWFTLIPWMRKHGLSMVKAERPSLILLRACAGFFSFVFLFLAVNKISLVNAVLLNNLSPILIPVIVWIWLRIPMNPKLWVGIICGFLGVIFILRPGIEVANLGILFGLMAAILSATAMVTLRLLSLSDRNHTVLFYYFLIGFLLPLPFTWLLWKTPTWIEWLILVGSVVFVAGGQWAFVRAFHYAKATLLGPFCYVAVVYSGLLDWFIYGEVPDAYAWVGICLVALGGIWTIFLHPPTAKSLEDTTPKA